MNSGSASRTALSTTQRLVYALALLPIVPSVATVGATLCTSYLPVPAFDDLRWFHLLFSMLWVAGTVVIFRSLVVWTLGRKWLTALICMIPFVQVVLGTTWVTLQSQGCVGLRPEMLRMAQEQLGIGVYTWLAVWLWWGTEKLTMNYTSGGDGASRPTLSRTAQAVVGSLGSVPILFGVFMISTVLARSTLRITDEYMFVVGFLGAATVALRLWLVIWRRPVAWSRAVIGRTVVLWAILMLLPIVALAVGIWRQPMGPILEPVLYLAPVVGWGLWMAVTVRFWPMKPGARGQSDLSPRCLKCGYLLTGLRATRCPECGDEPTIDELWAATTAQW